MTDLNTLTDLEMAADLEITKDPKKKGERRKSVSKAYVIIMSLMTGAASDR